MNIPVEFKVSSPPFRWDEAGGIRIGETRVTLDSVLASYNQGSTPEEIAIQFSVLRLEDIYSAIAYYLNYREEIDNYLNKRQQNAKEMREEIIKGIRIPKAIIEQAQLENKELKFKVTDEGLLIQPVNKPREGWKEQFDRLLSTQESNNIDQEWLNVPLSSDEDWEW